MPTVPVYERQVSTQALRAPLAQASPDANTLGLGRAQALKSFVSPLIQIEQEERKKANEVGVQAAIADYLQWETNKLHDSSSGILSRQGAQAFTAPEEFDTDFNTVSGDIEKKLSNDEQRAAFRQSVDKRKLDAYVTIQRHVGAQRHAWDKSKTESYLEQLHASAIASPGDTRRIDAEIKNTDAALDGYAARNPGAWTPEELALKKASRRSTIHMGVVGRLLAQGQDLDAKKYFEVRQDEFYGADRTEAEKVIIAGSVRGESQRLADSIGQQHAKRADALEAAKAIEDPDVRDAVTQRLMADYQARAQDQKALQDAAYMTAAQHVQRRGLVEDIPPRLRMELEPGQVSALYSMSNAIRNGKEPVTKPEVLTQFYSLDKSGLKKLTEADMLRRYRPNLSDSHYDRALSLWREAVDSDGKDTPQITSSLTFKDRIDATLRIGGVIPADASVGDLGKDSRIAYEKLHVEAADALDKFERVDLEGKRKASQPEMQKVIDDLVLRKVFVERTLLSDPELPAFAVPERQRQRVYVPIEQIPQANKDEIIPMFGNANWTTEDLQRAFGAYQLRDRKLFDQVLKDVKNRDRN